jgi:hypothetical protein
MTKRLSFVLGVLGVLGVLPVGAVACATAGTSDVGGGGQDSGVALDDSGQVVTGGDSGNAPGNDSGNVPPGDSGNPSPDGSSSTCVKPPIADGGGAASCGLSPQCGCASNQTCDVTSANGSTACVNAGTATLGHACSGTGGCAVGLTCVFGACHPYCATAGSQCAVAGTGVCYQVQNQQSQPVPNLDVCLIACALDDATSCGPVSANQNDPVAGCTIIDNANHPDCATAGRSTTTCGANGAPPLCGPGYACTTAGGCVKWCKVGGANTCGAQTCRSFSPPVVVVGIEFGGCG